MTERKNIKVHPDTHELLKEEKGDMETFDRLLERLVRESKDDD
jgi:hypothetical protein